MFERKVVDEEVENNGGKGGKLIENNIKEKLKLGRIDR